ncbi:MAG: DUF2470 domain-containing protein [Pseudomonadota bacterium]
MSSALTLAEEARTLVQQTQCAVLSAISSDGTPYGSIVEIAPDIDGNAVMLLSQLAEHRRYLEAQPQASLLIAPHLNQAETLAKPRVCLQGRAIQVDDPSACQDLYLQRHPQAEMYLSFGDFHFFHFETSDVRFIAGFGRMGWVTAADYRAAQPDVLWEVAPGAIEHMNDDHVDSVLNYVHHYADATWATQATLLSLDGRGMTIDTHGEEHSETLRVNFDPVLVDADQLRPRLIEMSRAAKSEK